MKKQTILIVRRTFHRINYFGGDLNALIHEDIIDTVTVILEKQSLDKSTIRSSGNDERIIKPLSQSFDIANFKIAISPKNFFFKLLNVAIQVCFKIQ